MRDQLTLELAREAGLCAVWKNYRGEPRQVSLDTLRSLLATLDLSAGSEAEAADCLRRLRDARAERIPSLLVGRAGAPLHLPPALAALAGNGVELHYEAGEHTSLHHEREADGTGRLSGVYLPGYHQLRVGPHELTVAIAPQHRPGELALRPRRWGAAAQLYGLRRAPPGGEGEHGLGDLGLGDFSAVGGLARRLAAHGAQALAISPVHALFSADVQHFSPYSPSSRLFLNVLHIDPAALAGAEWLGHTIDQLGLRPEAQRLRALELIEWPAAARLKLRLLRALWHDFERLDRRGEWQREFDGFRWEAGAALEDHARFEAIHAAQFNSDPARWHWRDWPAGLRDPGSAEVTAFAAEHADEVRFHCFLQWLAGRGLRQAQVDARAAGLDIGLITDLAVGTDSGGSHAWSRQQDMLIGASIGAPPDELNAQGQNWGLTTFSPRALRQHGYAPFVELLRASLRHAGGLRIDHILGLDQLWLVPNGASAAEGAYLDYPQQPLMHLVALETWRHGSTVVGEDLGTVPEGFRDQLAEAGLLGMRVLYFERDHGYYIEPARWSSSSVALTTTHDLPTVAGWWQGNDIAWKERLALLPADTPAEQLRRERSDDRVAMWSAFRHEGLVDGEPPELQQAAPVVDAAIAFVARTPAPLALIPLEDLLGEVEQPNLPGTTDQHPNWRRRLPAPVDDAFAQPTVAARVQRLAQERPG